MEHLLQLGEGERGTYHNNVSILIFMEHLLQLILLVFLRTPLLCFNPYFYGTSTSTLASPIFFLVSLLVSILIFMEHLLQPRIQNSPCICQKVSILIFMEHLLQQPLASDSNSLDGCFNPYFYGTSTSTLKEDDSVVNIADCFNPYFYGTSTSTLIILFP